MFSTQKHNSSGHQFCVVNIEMILIRIIIPHMAHCPSLHQVRICKENMIIRFNIIATVTGSKNWWYSILLMVMNIQITELLILSFSLSLSHSLSSKVALCHVLNICLPSTNSLSLAYFSSLNLKSLVKWT